MYITESDPKVKTVDDLDFTFSNGLVMPITIDKAAGDVVDWNIHEDAIVIHLSAKPSQDGESTLPAEDITVFRKNILLIQHRTREITELTSAQKREISEWKKTLQEVPKTLQ